MKNSKGLAVTAALLWCASSVAHASPVVFVVRHAEKASATDKDPDLSAAGHKRADELARVVKDAELRAIFATEFKRTQQTAASTANATHLSPIIVPASDTSALVTKLQALNGNALVIAHSNTIPELLKTLGVETPINMADDDYAELLMIIMTDHPQLVRLHYSS
ncbi:MAG: phosphoglycerate mutase family protein [Chthoniobacterales bacterium]|jgi:phosphohistidine phosphatase SixA